MRREVFRPTDLMAVHGGMDESSAHIIVEGSDAATIRPEPLEADLGSSTVVRTFNTAIRGLFAPVLELLSKAGVLRAAGEGV